MSALVRGGSPRLFPSARCVIPPGVGTPKELGPRVSQNRPTGARLRAVVSTGATRLIYEKSPWVASPEYLYEYRRRRAARGTLLEYDSRSAQLAGLLQEQTAVKLHAPNQCRRGHGNT